MMNDKDLFTDIKCYSEMGKLSVFVGAGVSRLSGYPSWYSLVQSMADEIGCSYAKDDKGNGVFAPDELLKIPQMYYINKKENYRTKVEKGFENSCIPNEIHHLILSLQPNHILTTNYDTLLEDTAIKFGRNFSVINSNQVVAKAETENYILKVHGDFSSDFVLKEQDYLDYENDYVLIDNLMKTIFATNLVIFIGYGLNDYNIKLILNWVKRVQSDSFIMPVFIHTGEKLNDLENEYQKARGLRILDCNNYTDSNDYIQRYKLVLEKILLFNDENNLIDDAEKLQYIFNKLSGIRNLSYIRKDDFNSIFQGSYELNDEWKIVNRTKSYDAVLDDKNELKSISKIRLDYFEKLFNNEEDFKSVNEEQFNYVKDFLRMIGVKGMETDDRFFIPEFIINSPAFTNQYQEMREFCSKEYEDVKNNYKKAYYFAQLGEYALSYELFTDLLADSKKYEQWDIYYFALINRHYLYSIIKQMITLTTGFQGSINFGRSLKMFDDNFINNLSYEMGKNKLENQFFELPYEFKSYYIFLNDFSQRNCYLRKYYELTKEKYEIDESLQKDVMSFGISKFDKLKVDMLDTTKFLYENMLLFSPFNENKLYIKNIMSSWLEAYVKETSKSEYGVFGAVSNSRYEFTVTDIILITKSFKKEDIEYLSNKIDIAKIPFNETDALENYINNQIDMYKDMFKDSLSGGEIFMWKLFSEEIRMLLTITPYFVQSNACKIKVIEFIVSMGDGHFGVSDRIRIIKKWIRFANVEKASPIIERWFINKITPVLNNKIPIIGLDQENSDIAMIAQLLGDVISKDEYDTQGVSRIIIDNKDNQYCNIKHLEGLYAVLNDDAKRIYDSKYIINNVFELMQRGYSNAIPDGCNETQIIESYLKKILDERKENAEKGIKKYSFPSDEEHIGDVAAYMFMMNFPISFTSKFDNICDEYDFLLNPGGFNVERFHMEWLFTYSNNLFIRLKNNPMQKKMIIEMIDKAISNFKNSAKQLKRLFDIYKIVTTECDDESK